MQTLIKQLTNKIKKKYPKNFETVYYQKMAYNDTNTVLSLDSSTLIETICIETTCVHLSTYLLNHYLRYPFKSYMELLQKIDATKIFSWCSFSKDDIEPLLLSDNYTCIKDIQTPMDVHDHLICKEMRSVLGQFYTPSNITTRMLDEIDFTTIDCSANFVDPSCGTGVFLTGFINKIKSYYCDEWVLKYVIEKMYAYDINPFAVAAAKLNMLAELLYDSTTKFRNLVEEYLVSTDILFPNILWFNTLTETDTKKYQLIVCNPPYFKMTKASVVHLTEYHDISFGQPNIYSFFIKWGLSHLDDNAGMYYIVPQSLRSGLYFKKLRELLSSYYISTIMYMASRNDIFKDAEQAVQIIVVKNTSKLTNSQKCNVRFYDSADQQICNFHINQNQLIKDKKHNNVFIISQHFKLYDIVEKAYRNSNSLDGIGLKFKTGLYVWNQHKSDLRNFENNAYPIIYGTNIQPLDFRFSTASTEDEKKQFAIKTKKTASSLTSGRKLLVQRTSNFEKLIRIKSCIISDCFANEYQSYFIENHVNFLSQLNNEAEEVPTEEMYYVYGVINSKLFNYIYSSISGNTQVSANELNLSPFPQQRKKLISKFTQEHEQHLQSQQKELDLLVCNAYGLTKEDTEFIMRL